MKQCPTCGTTYTDASLLYCLADGAPLSGAGDEQDTVVRRGRDAMRVEVAPPAAPNPAAPSAGPPPSASNMALKVVLGLLVVGFLLASAVAIGTLVYFTRQGPQIATNATPMPSPTALPAATQVPVFDETEELRKQIADLAKRLSEQAASNRGIEIPLDLPNRPSSGTRAARVNSPGDGFLALRTFPNSEAGDRIMKIPHGATLTVGGCLNPTRIANRSGRWCRASYNGYSGWVFDGWLNY